MANKFNMPTIAEMPVHIRQNLELLSQDLNNVIPSKKLEQNVLIATWNIRAFGDLTPKWESGKNDSPKRDWHAAACIAEILKRFDVIAVQEVKANLRALRHTMKLMGDNYAFILTDVNQGNVGNGERMAFIYDTRRVQLSGLACELVVPQEWIGKPEGLSAEQFVRSPYAVSFRAGNKTFILVTMHIVYGDDSKDRIEELRGVARWMSNWAKDVNAYDQNLIALGDFNIEMRGDVLQKTFVSEGLYIPPQLADEKVLRSVFNESKFYDQIAWFNGENESAHLSMEFMNGGSYLFMDKALTGRKLKPQDVSWMMSDHYPLWAEFRL